MGSDLYHSADWEVQRQSVLYAVGTIAMAFGVGIMLGVAGLHVVNALGLTRESAPLVVNVTTTVLQFLGFIGVAVGFVWLRSDPDLIRWRRPSLRDAGWVVLGFAGLFAAGVVISAIAALLGLESAQNTVIARGQNNPTLFLYMIPITILLVGPGEELVFRGVVQGLLRRAFGVVPAIAGASVLFGVAHYTALIGSQTGIFTYIGQAALLGIVLGTIYEYTDNVIIPIVVHGFWNAMIFSAQWFAAVYDVPLPS